MIRAYVKVNGIVQGVGFRPFIHRQTEKFGLAGWIRNTSDGAEMELEGSEEKIDSFVSELWSNAPMLASIESVNCKKYTDLSGLRGFKIVESKSLDHRNTLISPDVCICEDCLKELRDPDSRRHDYPFINCTNCGPRFTIIKDVPYDRPFTTMGAFPMCDPCEKEYGDISDRRYHAQPVCCTDCGPHLSWKGEDGTFFQAVDTEGDLYCIGKAADYLRNGKIIAIKGLGGIHLACIFDDPEVPEKLRMRKHRDEKPFAVMCRDISVVRRFCLVSEDEEKILTGFRRPIVLLCKKEKGSLLQISENSFVGVMLPYTPLHYMLFDEKNGIDALVMTSANLSDLPIMFRNEEAFEHLEGIADGFLLNNRDIHVRCDDSLMWVFDGHEYPVRRSRGYVPFPVALPFAPAVNILACGAEQKASFCLTKGSYAFPSQHIGDLKNVETFDNYREQIAHFERLFDVKPEMLACDLHPDYMSTEYALDRSETDNIPILQIQHHYAHMASCMADNGLDESVIGIVWDGTGLGSDGTVWGGEFLTGDYSGFRRAGHIEKIRLPGGDRCMSELDRTGLSLLKDSGLRYDEIFPGGEKIAAVLDMNVNCPGSSGTGRLFDGIAAILGIKHIAGYEGQGAVLLEAAAEENITRSYRVSIVTDEDGCLVFEYESMLRDILSDMKKNVPTGEIAAVFMNTLVFMAVEMCIAIREKSGLEKVVLSGGSFQNQYMLSRLMAELSRHGFIPYCHRRVSCNDEGLSLGQVMIASRAAVIKEK